MDDDYYQPPAPDVMCQRVNALCDLAEAVDVIKNREVRRRLLDAMDVVLASISQAKREGGVVLTVV